VSSPTVFKIPIVDLRAQYSTLRDEVRQAIDDVNDTQQFILGPTVDHFEAQMANYLQCRFSIGVASGSDALLLALMALGVGPGDAVITTPFTFFSTVSCILRVGARPLFVDVDVDTCLTSVDRLSEFLVQRVDTQDHQIVDKNTQLKIQAVLPVHLFGRCCAMHELIVLARKYRFKIIEDVAQACGARTSVAGEERFAGAIGDLGCFSFFPSKTLGAFGDGGLVTTQDRLLAEKIKMLRMHGEGSKYFHEVMGINSRLDSLQAAVLSIKQRFLEKWCQGRIEKAQAYYRLFQESGLIGNGLIGIPELSTDRSHVFNNYVVRAERREELKQFLARDGIQSEIYYPLPLHLQKCFAYLGYKKGEFPNAELLADQVLALPLYPELTIQQQEIVVRAVIRFYRS
jgi:dTDP-4-amino-4,6-dideoxygalactose transaminase